MIVMKTKQEFLLEAIEKGLPDDVLTFLMQGADVNAKGPDGDAPLHLAIGKGPPDIVRLLVAKGADVNAIGRGNEAPLHRAASLGRKDVAELLIPEGVNTTAGRSIGATLIVIGAASRERPGQPAGRKADVNVRTAYGETPLHYAARSAHRDIAELLIAAGADVNARARCGETPLHNAAGALRHAEEVVELLMAKGADVNARDQFGMTPLHSAASHGNTGIAEVLLAHGADVNAREKKGRTALYSALEKGYPAFADLLRRHGASNLAVEEQSLIDEAESRRRRAADAAKPAFVKVIENSATLGASGFDDLRNALSTAEQRHDCGPELLSPLLVLYQQAVAATWYGADRSDAVWSHVERFEHAGARKEFEQFTIIKAMTLGLIRSTAFKTGSRDVLTRVRSAMEQSRDSSDPLIDDSARDIASRSSYCAAIDLIDRLLGS